MEDEMTLKLSTKFMRNLVAKLMSRFIRKRIGYKIDIQLNELNVSIIDGKARIQTNVELELDNDEFKKLMKSIGSGEEELWQGLFLFAWNTVNIMKNNI